MKRPQAKRRPKHVRQLCAKLGAAGHRDVAVEVQGNRFLLTWRVGRATLRLACSARQAGDSIAPLWAHVRSLFRERGLPVPA